MANLLDYISWRGDLPVCSAAPLNDLDASLSRASAISPSAKHRSKTATVLRRYGKR